MEKTLNLNAIVILNSGIDPQSFNAFWLVTNGILKEEELALEHIFTKQFVQLSFEKYDVFINGNSFQFSVKNNDLSNFNELVEKAKKLIDATSNTTNISVGINFNWILHLQKGTYRALSKKIFYIPENDLFKNFDTDDACFGAYMSKDFEKSRLKLDIKPVTFTDSSEEDGSINFNFNFHLDLPLENKIKTLKDYIESWGIYYEESKKNVEALKIN